MTIPVSHLNDPDMQKVPQALMRAEEAAQELFGVLAQIHRYEPLAA